MKKSQLDMGTRIKIVDFIREHSLYKKAKLSDEELASNFTKETGIPVTVVNISSTRRSAKIVHRLDTQEKLLIKIVSLLERLVNRLDRKTKPSA